MTHNEHGCAYHGPRAHHATQDCRRRIRLMIEEIREENDRRIQEESRRFHNNMVATMLHYVIEHRTTSLSCHITGRPGNRTISLRVLDTGEVLASYLLC